MTWNLMLAASMAIVGSSFQFGYNANVINVPQIILEQFFNHTYYIRYGEYISTSTLNLFWGITTSIFAVGGMVGSLCTSWSVLKFGLKRSILHNNLLVLIAVLLMGFCKLAGSYEMLILGQLLAGLNCGFNMALAPMYLTEIAPVRFRGMFGTLGQLGAVVAMLISQVLGLHLILGTKDLWPLLLTLSGVFSIYQLIVIPFCPESPRYTLLVKNDEIKAREDLQWLHSNEYDVTHEINLMESERQEEVKGRASIMELFRTQYLRQPLFISVMLQLSQSFSGQYVLFYFSTHIFIEAGFPRKYAGIATVIMGAVNVIMTLVSVALIERAGRRTLHLIGLGGMCISSSLLVVFLNMHGNLIAPWLTFAAIIVFTIFFQTGPGSIPWFIAAELFNQRSRPTAVGFAGIFNWLGSFVLTLAYPSVDAAIGGYTFVIFAALLALFWIFTYFNVPETKNLSISETTALFKK